ncbi:hypothetical protein CH380_05395 [Leptospira adleri]|uniref:Uncharacterized protein n=1 Tax=Leptospira adleri TaxID=2023186 RepID=A0A2M9YSL3_9LEPT|nr:hypothetical protein [Leptospira adleri]PJZ54499.1 hypothetical protein CH380_05395 [Leptospira adleri]PJZ61161.1 hypothetical protein CH376_14560 [Leptospira adleri]
MAKKDLLKQAAGAHVRKTLGGENSPETPSLQTDSVVSEESLSVDSSPNVPEPSSEILSEEKVFEKESLKTENPPIQNSSSSEAREEKHLPKKNHLHRISSVMRLEDYTRPESAEREGSSRFLKIAGVILLALAIWFFWPAKHEIYMDIDKMTPEKVSGMSSQKEYHFSHGQDFFIYYKKGWSTPKRVRLSIYKTDGGKEEFSVQEKDFRKSFEKFQTYYDDTFFDQQGSYEVEIRDEDGELLVNKKFTID